MYKENEVKNKIQEEKENFSESSKLRLEYFNSLDSQDFIKDSILNILDGFKYTERKLNKGVLEFTKEELIQALIDTKTGIFDYIVYRLQVLSKFYDWTVEKGICNYNKCLEISLEDVKKAWSEKLNQTNFVAVTLCYCVALNGRKKGIFLNQTDVDDFIEEYKNKLIKKFGNPVKETKANWESIINFENKDFIFSVEENCIFERK